MEGICFLILASRKSRNKSYTCIRLGWARLIRFRINTRFIPAFDISDWAWWSWWALWQRVRASDEITCAKKHSQWLTFIEISFNCIIDLFAWCFRLCTLTISALYGIIGWTSNLCWAIIKWGSTFSSHTFDFICWTIIISKDNWKFNHLLS